MDAGQEGDRSNKESIRILKRYVIPNFNGVVDILPGSVRELADILETLETLKTHDDSRLEFSDKDGFVFELWIEEVIKTGEKKGRIFPFWINKQKQRLGSATFIATKRYDLDSNAFSTIEKLEKSGEIRFPNSKLDKFVR